jgi:hypothetical protein
MDRPSLLSLYETMHARFDSLGVARVQQVQQITASFALDGGFEKRGGEVQSSRRLERECQRNIELVWLTGRLMPDFKTIADFRKDNGEAIRKVCREFVVLCRRLELFSEASVAIDGSKFKAVNTRDRNFTQAKMQRRLAQIDESIARYLSQLDSADRQGEAVPEAKITRLNEKITALRQEIQRLNGLNTDDADRGQADIVD